MKRTKYSSLLSQPFNKEAYCALRNMKGFFKRNRLYNFHLSFIHFSFPMFQHLLEVYHSGNTACKELSCISQQDGFPGKLLGWDNEVCYAHRSLAHLSQEYFQV